jgi:hypothetical protein
LERFRTRRRAELRSPARRVAAAATVVVRTAGALVVVALAACTGGGGAGGDAGEVATAEARARTSPTEPRASDLRAVEPYIEDLLARYDRVVNDIVADPTVAGDPDNPAVQEYVSLFEPDSAFVEQVLAAWVAEGENGRSVEPYDDQSPAFESHLDGEIEALSDDEVVFPVCVERRMSVYVDGALRQETAYFAEPGGGSAVRVDGTWRLRRLDIAEGMAGCGGTELLAAAGEEGDR